MLGSRLSWLFLAALTLLVCGCGGGATKVTGTATLESGTKLTAGNVEFTPIGEGMQNTAIGEIGEDGTFTIGTYTADDGAPAGKYKVIILGTDPPISSIYSEPEDSPLEVEVKSGEDNHFDFKLKPEK